MRLWKMLGRSGVGEGLNPSQRQASGKRNAPESRDSDGMGTQKRRKIPPPPPASQPAKGGSRSAATTQARKLGSAPSRADRVTASEMALVPSSRGKRVLAEQVCGREGYGKGMRACPLAIAHRLILVRPVAQVNMFPLLSPTFLLATEPHTSSTHLNSFLILPTNL